MILDGRSGYFGFLSVSKLPTSGYTKPPGSRLCSQRRRSYPLRFGTCAWRYHRNRGFLVSRKSLHLPMQLTPEAVRNAASQTNLSSTTLRVNDLPCTSNEPITGRYLSSSRTTPHTRQKTRTPTTNTNIPKHQPSPPRPPPHISKNHTPSKRANGGSVPRQQAYTGRRGRCEGKGVTQNGSGHPTTLLAPVRGTDANKRFFDASGGSGRYQLRTWVDSHRVTYAVVVLSGWCRSYRRLMIL